MTRLVLQQGYEDEVGPRTLPLPIEIAHTKDPHVRELAFAAQKYGAAGLRDPGDFEAIYNHGLALQELALRCSGSRENQEFLLRQVCPECKLEIKGLNVIAMIH